MEPVRHARAKNSIEAVQSTTRSMYSRASCEYQIMNGLTAARAAATTPARAETISRPHRYSSGTSPTPRSADSDRRPASPVPNTLAHGQATIRYRGGFHSAEFHARSIAPKDRLSSWAA